MGSRLSNQNQLIALEKHDDGTIDPAYLQGFNKGFLIEQHEPEIAEILTKAESKSVGMRGIQAGIQEARKEKVKDYVPSWLAKGNSAQIKDNFKDRTGIDKFKDNFDKER